MSSPQRPRVVLDCNTFIQALAFEDGPAAEVLSLVESGEFELFISKATMGELRRVLKYPEVLAISPAMTALRVGAFLERLTFRATWRRRVRRAFHFGRDPRDEAYLDLAFAARADYLVSRDKDLLSLMTDHSVFAKQFRQATHPLKILDPPTFLKAIGRR